MIEVEKKFLPTVEQQERLLDGAVFVSKATMHDTYYDRGYELSAQWYWLRKRDDRWELKVPLRKLMKERPSVELYDELEEDALIIAKLGLSLTELSEEGLAREGIVPYADYQTTRATYTKDGFTITVDETSFGYKQCEVELLVDDLEHAQDAEERILTFAREQGLDTTRFVMGKVEMSVKSTDPDRYLAMQEAGIFPKDL